MNTSTIVDNIVVSCNNFLSIHSVFYKMWCDGKTTTDVLRKIHEYTKKEKLILCDESELEKTLVDILKDEISHKIIKNITSEQESKLNIYFPKFDYKKEGINVVDHGAK